MKWLFVGLYPYGMSGQTDAYKARLYQCSDCGYKHWVGLGHTPEMRRCPHCDHRLEEIIDNEYD